MGPRRRANLSDILATLWPWGLGAVQINEPLWPPFGHGASAPCKFVICCDHEEAMGPRRRANLSDILATLWPWGLGAVQINEPLWPPFGHGASAPCKFGTRSEPSSNSPFPNFYNKKPQLLELVELRCSLF